MTSTKSTNPLDRLEQLHGQRTARTQALWDATQSLCARLDDCTESGDSATVGEYTLVRKTIRSNVGGFDAWFFEFPDEDDELRWTQSVVLDSYGPDEEHYVHGDFQCQVRTANRRQLIVFAGLAGQFVARLLASTDGVVEQLEAATDQISKAL